MVSLTKPSGTFPTGIVLYHGRSTASRDNVVAIATNFNRSDNPKTGKGLQVWILPADINPVEAYKIGKDRIVCGDCNHSSIANGGWGTCYTKVHQAPNNVWKAWKNGSYENPSKSNIGAFRGKFVRIGAYGDPGIIPVEVWEKLAEYCDSLTGYTHLWNSKFTDKRLKQFCMASCDSVKMQKMARKKGWRTFRIREKTDNPLRGEIVCPASKEAGKKTTCSKCKFCGGLSSKAKKFAATIIFHGTNWKSLRFSKIMDFRRKKKSYKHLLTQPVRKGSK